MLQTNRQEQVLVYQRLVPELASNQTTPQREQGQGYFQIIPQLLELEKGRQKDHRRELNSENTLSEIQ